MRRAARIFWLACFMLALTAGLQPLHAQRAPVSREGLVQRATIHWQDVPLRDAIDRLTKLFGERSFLDRRIDPTVRVSLDMSASSAEQVLARLAAEHDWSVASVEKVVYLGPADAARQLRGAVAARKADIARLPQSRRAIFMRRRGLSWPRLTNPRALVQELVGKSGWRLAEAERIPHDLWPAGQLDGLTFAEQLTLLLVGFDLTYKIRAETRTVQIVELDKSAMVAQVDDSPERPAADTRKAAGGNTTQVYSLRVAEKPVGPIMRELARRLNWQVEFDEAAIEAAGLSLDARVSFAVENVAQDELLDALLRPAGLTFRRDGDLIKVVPRVHSSEGFTTEDTETIQEEEH
jgi:hypothetical protein